ncbi:MAG: hypothetical protein R3C01_12150 [Planctomycetaceae bacterium]
MALLTTILFLLSFVALFRTGRQLAETTLISAYWWSVVAMAIWGGVYLLDVQLTRLEHPIAETCWYVTVLFALTPLVAVLGARRPGVGAWNWFVVVPLLAVFGLFAVTNWRLEGMSAPIKVPAPLLAGLGVVMAMGLGNYLPTRYFVTVCLMGLAMLLVLLPVSTFVELSHSQSRLIRLAATSLLCGSVLFGAWASRMVRTIECPISRLWNDYWDSFGLIWAIRLSERFNAKANEEQWPWRLGALGLEPFPPREGKDAEEFDRPTPAEEAAMMRNIRWMIQRFVSDCWVERHLPMQTVNEDADKSSQTVRHR